MANEIIKSEVHGSTGSTIRLTCADCKAWAWEGGNLRHSKSCHTPNAQDWSTEAALAVVKEASPFALQAGEDIYDRDLRLVKQGHLSESDAMNTDY